MLVILVPSTQWIARAIFGWLLLDVVMISLYILSTVQSSIYQRMLTGMQPGLTDGTSTHRRRASLACCIV
jgi:hypothetical protein